MNSKQEMKKYIVWCLCNLLYIYFCLLFDYLYTLHLYYLTAFILFNINVNITLFKDFD